MKLCIYANCQGDGLAHFLRQAHPEWTISVHLNYRLMLGETPVQPLLDAVAAADAFIFQPTVEFEGKGGHVPSTDYLEKICTLDCKRISFAYQFNTGFFPIVKSGQWWTGSELLEDAKYASPGILLERFDEQAEDPDNEMIFDCARRFAENLAEQSRREASCTIKLAPWILENFQTKHLFVMHNHPASALFVKLACCVTDIIAAPDDHTFVYGHPNEAGLPGYHGVHPAVIRELGLQYEPNREGEDMEFYRTLITELLATKGVL